MPGRVTRNSDPSAFFADGQLILKIDGNNDQRESEPGDLVIGPIGDTTVASNPAQYRGGDKKNAASYDTNDTIDTNDFPNI